MGTPYSGNGLSSDISQCVPRMALTTSSISSWTGNTLARRATTHSWSAAIRLNGSATPFGLSYALTVVPEPTAAMLLLDRAPLLVCRRRR